mmetsp:Transcript_30334/g.72685  ORF Transcript_30334/g.72685 Transcript_30334/m.72685 type:complete len:181 (-) Transcript_30334:72-614(-)
MPVLSPLISKVAIHMSPQELQPYPLSKTSSGSSMFSILPTTSQRSAETAAEVDEIISPSRSRMSSLRPRRVTFKPTVTVRSIPHFNRYPPAIKKKIWRSPAEIDWNARRNRIEFRAEGCDWRKVVMEDQMHVDVAMGELIHPCHVSNSQQTTMGPPTTSGDAGGMTLFSTRRVQGELILV